MHKRKKSRQKSSSRQPAIKPGMIAPVIIELTINEVSRGGAGIGRDENGRAIFVPFTAPGDRVRVSLNKSKQNFAEADLLEIIEPSPQRQQPPCPVFTQCGGCQWQHLPYDLQWQTKREGLAASLRRVGVNTKIKIEEYPAKTIWNYRNRIQLRRKGAQLGFYSSQSHQIVPVSQCAIARPEINDTIQAINTEIKNDLKAEINNAAAETTDQPNIPRDESIKFELLLNLQGEVQQIINNQDTDHGFRQINDEQNLNLQTWIKQSTSGINGVLDLYGASGNLSLPLADSVEQIHCVDINIATNNTPCPDNMSFHQSAVKPWLERKVAKTKYTQKTTDEQLSWLALIDPPRSGLDKDGDAIIQYLKKLNVTTVILVGCKTDPWTRDVAKFISQGWTLDKIALFDFFPQTFHVESVALLSI